MDQRQLCCKTDGACSTKGHKTRVSLSTKTIYIEHNHNCHAHLEPSLGVSLLPDDGLTVSNLLKQEIHLVAYLESLQAEKVGATAWSTPLSTTALSPWEEVVLPTLEGLRKARDSFKSPKKLGLGSVLVPDNIPFSNLSSGALLTMVGHDIDDSPSDHHAGLEQTRDKLSVYLY
jgi:hypothetical protein